MEIDVVDSVKTRWIPRVKSCGARRRDSRPCRRLSTIFLFFFVRAGDRLMKVGLSLSVTAEKTSGRRGAGVGQTIFHPLDVRAKLSAMCREAYREVTLVGAHAGTSGESLSWWRRKDRRWEKISDDTPDTKKPPPARSACALLRGVRENCPKTTTNLCPPLPPLRWIRAHFASKELLFLWRATHRSGSHVIYRRHPRRADTRTPRAACLRIHTLADTNHPIPNSKTHPQAQTFFLKPSLTPIHLETHLLRDDIRLLRRAVDGDRKVGESIREGRGRGHFVF